MEEAKEDLENYCFRCKYLILYYISLKTIKTIIILLLYSFRWHLDCNNFITKNMIYKDISKMLMGGHIVI